MSRICAASDSKKKIKQFEVTLKVHFIFVLIWYFSDLENW